MKKKFLLSLSVSVVVFIAFLPSLFCEFTNWDDDWMVTNNLLVRELSARHVFNRIFGEIYMGVYQPLVFLTYAIEYYFFELNPIIYHLDNVLLHVLNTLLVFYFVKLLSANEKVALVACLFWSLNPLRVESVTWVTERKDLLYAFFYLLSLIKYIHYIQSGDKVKHLVFSLLFFVLSCMSKLTAVSLSLAVLLLDYYYVRKLNIRSLAEKFLFFGISLSWGLFSIWAVFNSGDENVTNFFFSFVERIQIASYSFLNYLTKSVIPYNLSAYHPYQYHPGNLPRHYVFYPLFAICIVAVTLWLFIKQKNKKIIFGLLFFVAAVVFALQFLPVGDVVLADRNIYISAVGIAFLAGELYVYSERIIPKIILKTFTIVVLAIYFFFTHQQTKVWQNSISLFSDIINKYPMSPEAYNNLGVAKLLNKNFHEAFADFQKSLDLSPYYPMPLCNRAKTKKALKDTSGAIMDYSTVINLRPTNVNAYNGRALIYYETRQFRKAIDDYSKVILLGSKYYQELINAYYNRGLSRLALKEIDSALIDFNSAVSINPFNPDSWYMRGVCYYYNKDYKQARGDLIKAISIDSGHVNSYYYLASIDIINNDVQNACANLQHAIKLGKYDARHLYGMYCNPKTRQKMFYSNGKPKFRVIEAPSGNKDTIRLLNNYDSLGNTTQQGMFDISTGKYKGEIRWYYPGSILKKVGFSNDTVPYGEWREYYENDSLRARYYYQNGLINGLYKYYHTNGILWTEKIYRQGKLFKVLSNYNSNGTPQQIGSFNNGTGTLNIYDEAGKIIQVQMYKDGIQVK